MYLGNNTALDRAIFGMGMGRIWLDSVNCDGSETRLVDCPYSTVDNCSHSEDVGVICLCKDTS